MLATGIARLIANGYKAEESKARPNWIKVMDPVMVLGTGGQPNLIEHEERHIHPSAVFKFIEERR